MDDKTTKIKYEAKIKYEIKNDKSKNPRKENTQSILTIGRTIALVSAILLIVSACMKWGHILNEEVYAFARGYEGDGKITIILGLFAFILLFIRKIPIWVSLILGIAALAVGVVVLNSINDAIRTSSDFGANAGIYLSLIASAGIIVGSIVEMVRKNKDKCFYLD